MYKIILELLWKFLFEFSKFATRQIDHLLSKVVHILIVWATIQYAHRALFTLWNTEPSIEFNLEIQEGSQNKF